MKLDTIKYKIIEIKNDLNKKARDIELLTQQLNYIWIEIEKTNSINHKQLWEELKNCSYRYRNIDNYTHLYDFMNLLEEK